VELEGRPLIRWTLEPLLAFPGADEVLVVVHHADRERCTRLLQGVDARIRVITGGKERQDSVYAGLRALSSRERGVLIHDGARPLVTLDTIHRVADRSAARQVGVVAGRPLHDTVKRVVHGTVVETLPRRLVWAVQTPQAFPAGPLLAAYETAMRDGFYGTDDAALCERIGEAVEVVEGDPWNLKVTTPEDMELAGMILRRRGGR